MNCYNIPRGINLDSLVGWITLLATVVLFNYFGVHLSVITFLWWHNYIILRVLKRNVLKLNENRTIDNNDLFTTYNTDLCWKSKSFQQAFVFRILNWAWIIFTQFIFYPSHFLLVLIWTVYNSTCFCLISFQSSQTWFNPPICHH